MESKEGFETDVISVLQVLCENWVVYHYFNLRQHRYEMSVLEIYDQSRLVWVPSLILLFISLLDENEFCTEILISTHRRKDKFMQCVHQEAVVVCLNKVSWIKVI